MHQFRNGPGVPGDLLAASSVAGQLRLPTKVPPATLCFRVWICKRAVVLARGTDGEYHQITEHFTADGINMQRFPSSYVVIVRRKQIVVLPWPPPRGH